MSADLAWLRQQFSMAYATARAAVAQATHVAEHRQDMAGMWNDQCGRDMAARFLNPIATARGSAEAALTEQHAHLDAGHAQLDAARSAALVCSDLSREIEMLVEEASSLSRILESLENESTTRLHDSEKLVAASRDLVRQADGAGNSTPDETDYSD